MNFLEEIQNVVKNRLMNPITGTFGLIWIICNWRFILILFGGDEKINIRIRILEAYINPDDMIITPIIYTLIYIFIIPQVTYFVRFYNAQINGKAERMEIFFLTKDKKESSKQHSLDGEETPSASNSLSSVNKLNLTKDEKRSITEQVISEIEPYIERKLLECKNNRKLNSD
jgi:hypothetical protein